MAQMVFFGGRPLAHDDAVDDAHTALPTNSAAACSCTASCVDFTNQDGNRLCMQSFVHVDTQSLGSCYRFCIVSFSSLCFTPFEM